MFCEKCGHEIESGAAFCSECGAARQGANPASAPGAGSYAAPVSQPAAQKAPYDTASIVGLVISGVSLLINPLGVVGIAGIIVSAIGLRNCRKKKLDGKPLAITGIAIGSVTTLYAVVSLVLVIVRSVAMGAFFSELF